MDYNTPYHAPSYSGGSQWKPINPPPSAAVWIPGLTLTAAESKQHASLSQPPILRGKPKFEDCVNERGPKRKGWDKKTRLREEEALKRTTPIPANFKPRDERIAPSNASGGVPNPTHAYLNHCMPPSTALSSPRRILIIMDLNGTLLYRPDKRRPFHFVERPHARRFLDYCLSTFNLAIWSSARPQNVHKMVEQLLTPNQIEKCVVVWARDHFGLSAEDYDSRVQCYKRLNKLWEDPRVMTSHPDATRGGKWDQSNTVLVDDSIEKGRSEPFNILPIPEFSGVVNEKMDVLPQVHDYLNTLCWQSDISRYMKQIPFRLDNSYALPAN